MKVILGTLFLVLFISACENHRSQYETEMKICTKSEEFGLLASAVNACQKALVIAENYDYSPSLRSQLRFKLASLIRRQGNFSQSEMMLIKNIEFEKQRQEQDSKIIAASLLELSLCLAGQKKWHEGAEALASLVPMISVLPENKKLTAKNTLKQYSIQLGKNKKYDLAENFNKVLDQL